MDTILIRDLEGYYCVGVPDAERAHPPRLLLTIEMETDSGPAAATDDLTRTIDYEAVSRRLLGLGAGREWRLLETLAAEIAQLVLRDFAALAVTVEVQKFILPAARHVAVRIRRARAGS